LTRTTLRIARLDGTRLAASAWPAAAGLLALVLAREVTQRRRAERELERFSTLSLDLVCVAGLDGYFKRVNPAFERTLGYSSSEMLARPFIEFIHPDDRSLARDLQGELSSGRDRVHQEIRNVRKDGSVCWLDWNAQAAPDEGLLYATARDITERKQLEGEQAALRRVATAVAHGASPDEVVALTVTEVKDLVDAETTALLRYDSDDFVTYLTGVGENGFEPGQRLPLTGDSASARVWRTSQPARIDSFAHAPGPIADQMRASDVQVGIGAPVVVDGRLWGVMNCGWRRGSPPPDAEARVAQFTDLVGTAIANAESRAQLLASRARIVATADQTRRRIERDLHDGAQQRLVGVTMKLRALEWPSPQAPTIKQEVEDIAAGLDAVLEDLRETARGLHPVILSRSGLSPALEALARRSPIPVELDTAVDVRLSEPVEAAAYYVAAEALTNAAKHSDASLVRLHVDAADGNLRICIEDDGVGGADPVHGSGLVGLADRVEALGGRMTLRSPAGGGTAIRIELPVRFPESFPS
jgi:PAS domain S-box-containing protein